MKEQISSWTDGQPDDVEVNPLTESDGEYFRPKDLQADLPATQCEFIEVS